MILDSNILIGVLAICVLCLTADIFHLRHTLRRVFRDKNCGDMGSALATLGGDIKELEKFRSDMEDYLKEVEKRVRRSTQAAETVRFNAFRGDGLGGNQSFATALLDENGDGTVLSSLYTRERVSVFAKPVKRFSSENELSEEERRAISIAREKIGKK